MKNNILAISCSIFILALSACHYHGQQSSDKTSMSNSKNDEMMSNKWLYENDWRLIELTGFSADINPKISVKFFVDGKLSGFSGCNRFHGQADIKESMLKVSALGTTRKACHHQMAQEAKVLKMFREVDHYQIRDKKLSLYRGEQLLGRFQSWP